jgi:hypothetical protein
MSKYFKKFIDLFPSYELPENKLNKLIDDIANKTIKLEMELPALLIVHALIPLGPVLSQTILVPVPPLLELMGIRGYDYIALLNNRDAIKRLSERITELKEFRDEKKLIDRLEREVA